MSGTLDRQIAYFAAPFAPQPVSGNGLDVDSAIRLGKAGEYAAAQLGILARTAEKIEQHLAKIANSSPSPGSAEEAMQRSLGKALG